MKFGHRVLPKIFFVMTIYGVSIFSDGALAMVSEPGLRCKNVVSLRSTFQKADLKRLSEYPNWSRLELFFSNSSNWKLKGLFEKLSPQDLKAGEMMTLHPQNSVDPVVKQLIQDIAWFYRNDPQVFWSRDAKGKIGDLKGRILESLAKIKEREVQKPGTGGAFGTDPQSSIRALRESEKLILDASVGDGPKQSHELRRWVQPLFGPVLQIIEFNNYIMRESKVIQDIDVIIAEAIQRNKSIGMTESDLAQVKRTLEDTSGQLIDLQVLIADAYGVDVAKGHKLSEDQTRVYKIASQISQSSFKSARESANLTAIRDLDRLDGILERRRKETQTEIYPTQDYSTFNLQTRFLIRSLGLRYKMQSYKEATSKEPGVSYSDSWTETTLVTKGSGKDATTELVTTHHSATRYPSYEDIIQNSFYSKGSTNGLSLIKEQSASFRQKELSLRQPVMAANELAKALIADPSKLPDLEMQIEQTLSSLGVLKSEVWDYLHWNSEAIHQQWVHDRVADFRDRNSGLYRVIENQIRFFEAVQILAQRQADLLPQYDLPNRDQAIQILKSRWKNSRVSQAVLATTAVSYGIAGLFYPQIFEVTHQHLSPFLNYLAEATGPSLQIIKETTQQSAQALNSMVEGWIDSIR